MQTVNTYNPSAEYTAAHKTMTEFEVEKCRLIRLVVKRLEGDEDITDVLEKLKSVKNEIDLARDALNEVMAKED